MRAPDDLVALMAESWPPEGMSRVGPWCLRHAPGAGNRVTCATADGPVAATDLPPLIAAARAAGQMPTVMLRGDESVLDALLAAEGWAMGEDVVLHAADLPLACDQPPPLSAFAVWPPLGVQRRLWDEDGIGAAKQRVMNRAPLPKAAILGRTGDRAAGTAFVAIVRGVAFLHALTVAPALRRRGTARNMLAAAAQWAQGEGATRLALAVTRGNLPARSLYASAGMQPVGHYHYRVT